MTPRVTAVPLGICGSIEREGKAADGQARLRFAWAGTGCCPMAFGGAQRVAALRESSPLRQYECVQVRTFGDANGHITSVGLGRRLC